MSRPDGDLEGALEALGKEREECLQEAAGLDVRPGRAEAALRARIEAETAQAAASASGTSAPARARASHPGSTDAPPGPPTARPLRLAAGLAAVAATVALALWITGGESPPDRDDVMLGAAVTPLAPVGEVADFDVFRFEAPLDGGGWAEVSVYDDAGEGTDPLVVSGRLTGSEWRPDPLVTRSWKGIRWRVEVWTGGALPRLVAASEDVRAHR